MPQTSQNYTFPSDCRSLTSRAGPVLQIRADTGITGPGLSFAQTFTLKSNIYFDAKEVAGPTFLWGHGVMLEDERANTSFVGNLTGWNARCTNTSLNIACDSSSVEKDPALAAWYQPLSCSPAVGAAASLVDVLDDFDGQPRVSGSSDIGAVSRARASSKPWPPVPSIFASIPPFLGLADPTPDFDPTINDWWLARGCADIVVDQTKGNDAQYYNSNDATTYKSPFKSLSSALSAARPCDRILLAGGQTHVGPVRIYLPNITIMTRPSDAQRATVWCPASIMVRFGPCCSSRIILIRRLLASLSGTFCCNLNHGFRQGNCFYFGDGLYDGCSQVTLMNFDVRMDGTQGNCIHFNEGQGSGQTPYFASWAATHPTVSNTAAVGC